MRAQTSIANKSGVSFLAVVVATIFSGACSNRNQTADAYGNFEATELVISAEASGRLLEFRVDEGIVLSQGQVVGLIDTLQLSLTKRQLAASRRAVESRLAGVAAQIAVLQEQRRVAEKEQARVERLLEDQAATTKQRDDIDGQIAIIDRQIDQARTQRASIYAEGDALEAQMAQIEDQVRRAVITNPVTGTVLTKFAEQHEIVAYGHPLYKLADLSTMELRAYVSGDQLSHLRIGQQVEIQIDENRGDSRSRKGAVSWIADEAEFTPKIIQTKEERVNLVYAFKVRVDNPDGTLKVGMPGEVWMQAAPTKSP